MGVLSGSILSRQRQRGASTHPNPEQLATIHGYYDASICGRGASPESPNAAQILISSCETLRKDPSPLERGDGKARVLRCGLRWMPSRRDVSESALVIRLVAGELSQKN
jgi:hypothetical protein